MICVLVHAFMCVCVCVLCVVRSATNGLPRCGRFSSERSTCVFDTTATLARLQCYMDVMLSLSVSVFLCLCLYLSLSVSQFIAHVYI